MENRCLGGQWEREAVKAAELNKKQTNNKLYMTQKKKKTNQGNKEISVCACVLTRTPEIESISKIYFLYRKYKG